MRQEIHRQYGGLKCRLVEYHQIGTLPLVRSFHTLDVSSEESANNDLRFQGALRLCRGSGNKCCISPECSEVNRYLGDSSQAVPLRKIRSLKHAYMCWRGMILSAERAHAGNQMRACGKFKKVRSLRRQAATYLVFLSRKRFAKVSADHKAMLNSLSSMSWKKFKKLTEKATKRIGTGGNPLRQHVANMSKAHGKQGYSKEWFNHHRKVWATEGKVLCKRKRDEGAREAAVRSPDAADAPNTPLLAMASRTYRRRVRQGRVNRQALRSAVADGGGQVAREPERDPKTHWGMGNKHMPLDVALLEKTISKFSEKFNCGKRGGLCKLSTKLLTETELAIRPNNVRLAANRQPACNKKHFGYCETMDADIRLIYDQVYTQLKSHQKAKDAGEVILRFRPILKATHFPPDDYNVFSDDRYMCFSWFRGNPKYAAFYMQMERQGPTDVAITDPFGFPFHLQDKFMELPAIPIDQYDGEMETLISSEMWNIYQCSKEIAYNANSRVADVSIAMEVLGYDVQRQMSKVCVTEIAQFITTDVLTDPAAQKDKDKEKDKDKDKDKDGDKNKKRKSRGILDKLNGDSRCPKPNPGIMT